MKMKNLFATAMIAGLVSGSVSMADDHAADHAKDSCKGKQGCNGKKAEKAGAATKKVTKPAGTKTEEHKDEHKPE